MILFFLSMGCWETPQTKKLPSSRIPTPIDSRMVRYGTMRGFLLQKKPVLQAFVWKTKQITLQTQQCAKRELLENSAALLIDTNKTSSAQSYLASWVKGNIIIQDLHCPSLSQ